MKIAVTGTDDPGFIEPINTVLRNIVSGAKSEQVWIIRIDNWFDHKRLRFGNGVLALAVPADKLTFPPFTPNRVVSQFSYVRIGNGYAEVALPSLPHATDRQLSEKHPSRRIQEISDSAVFVWFSGNTVANGRGSLMVYDVSDENVKCWFIAFGREECTWRVTATKGISRGEVETLLELSR